MKTGAIDIHQPLGHEVKRLILVYNQSAADYLIKSLNRNEGIHQARLCCKRIRSILRLIKPALSAKHFKEANQFYRIQAGKLSEVRDFTALSDAAEKLTGSMHSEASKHYLTVFIHQTRTGRIRRLRSFSKSDVRQQVIDDFMKYPVQIKELILNSGSEKTLKTGIERSYRIARRGFLVAEYALNAVQLHEWRKAAKYLWYMLEAVSFLHPTTNKAYIMGLKRLCALLGTYHDLELLQRAIETDLHIPKINQAGIRGSIRNQMKRIRQKALLEGALLFLSKPRQFSDTLFGSYRLKTSHCNKGKC